MIPNRKNISRNGMILSVIVLINAVILEHAFTINERWYWALIFTLPLFAAAVFFNKNKRKILSRSV